MHSDQDILKQKEIWASLRTEEQCHHSLHQSVRPADSSPGEERDGCAGKTAQLPMSCPISWTFHSMPLV